MDHEGGGECPRPEHAEGLCPSQSASSKAPDHGLLPDPRAASTTVATADATVGPMQPIPAITIHSCAPGGFGTLA